MPNCHDAKAPEDPLLRSARREAIVSLALAALALTYTIGYAALFGYGRTGDSLTFIFGIPGWPAWEPRGGFHSGLSKTTSWNMPKRRRWMAPRCSTAMTLRHTTTPVRAIGGMRHERWRRQ